MKILRETDETCVEEHRKFVFLLHLRKPSASLSWMDHAWEEIQLKQYFISLVSEDPDIARKTSEKYINTQDKHQIYNKLPNVNSSVAKPEAESAATTAQGPGIGITGIFSSTHNFAYNDIPNKHSLHST